MNWIYSIRILVTHWSHLGIPFADFWIKNIWRVYFKIINLLYIKIIFLAVWFFVNLFISLVFKFSGNEGLVYNSGYLNEANSLAHPPIRIKPELIAHASDFEFGILNFEIFVVSLFRSIIPNFEVSYSALKWLLLIKYGLLFKENHHL